MQSLYSWELAGGGVIGEKRRNNVQKKMRSDIFIVDKFCKNVHTIYGVSK